MSLPDGTRTYRFAEIASAGLFFCAASRYPVSVMSRVLLLLPTTTYRTKAYIDAALKLGVEVVAASEHPSTLTPKTPETLLTLDFFDPEKAAEQAVRYAAEYPIDAVIPVDEDTAVVGGYVAKALGLEHNLVAAV